LRFSARLSTPLSNCAAFCPALVLRYDVPQAEPTVTVEQFFAGHEDSARIFEALRSVVATIGATQVELRCSAEIDDEVRVWLQEAWEAAG
jgi:hypothetical protein